MTVEYVKLDLTSPNYAASRAKLVTAFNTDFPNNIFSENINRIGTMSWCKSVVGHGATQGVLRMARRAQHALVRNDINASWLPTEQ